MSKITTLLILSSLFIFSSCSKDKNEIQSLTELHSNYRESITQNFQLNSDLDTLQFVSQAGTEVIIPTNGLFIDGIPVTGMIDISFIEIFDKGSMVLADRPTTYQSSDGEYRDLVSGGEFYLGVESDGEVIDSTTRFYKMTFPSTLTGGFNEGMRVFVGAPFFESNPATAPFEFVWNDVITGDGILIVRPGDTPANPESPYVLTGNNFSWINCDYFFDDPRPKVPVTVKVESDLENEDLTIFLSYDGLNLISRVIDILPEGLACHYIAVMIKDGKLEYSIKPATITSGLEVKFAESDFSEISQEDLIKEINELP